MIRNGIEHGAWFAARGLDPSCITGSGVDYEFHTEHFVEGESLMAAYAIDAPDMIPAGSCFSEYCPFFTADFYTGQSRVYREKVGAA